MIQPIEYDRFGGMNTRNDASQLEPSRSRSARNVMLGRQTAASRRGYIKATRDPVWSRSVELNGLNTGIVACKLPENLTDYWDDDPDGGGERTKLTFQIRTRGVDMAAVGETEIPYSLDYNGGHEYPSEVKETIGATAPYDIYKRTTTAMGYESDDAKLWKPAAANRYDTTASRMYPWLPGNTGAVASADDVLPKMACVFGTGPLREFPLWQLNNSQKTWQTVTPLPTDWTYSFFDKSSPGGPAGTPRFPSQPATGGSADSGRMDAGDVYLYWVYSPFTGGWHLMFMWEYSDPGAGVGLEHAQGMNRMFVFAGWGADAADTVAATIDPSVPHTITCIIERDFSSSVSVNHESTLSIYVDDGTVFGVEKSEPKPAGGVANTLQPAAPYFGLRELSGLGEKTGSRVRPEWRGRTVYIGGLPKMTNQRGVYGYGCGKSVNPGGTIGVTCPYPGVVSEFRLYCGAFDPAVDLLSSGTLAPYDSRTIKRLAGGVAWDHSADPTTTKYTGCINIWRLDEESGDIFSPLYHLDGRDPLSKNLLRFGDSVDRWNAGGGTVVTKNATTDARGVLIADKVDMAVTADTLDVAPILGLVAGDTVTWLIDLKDAAPIPGSVLTFTILEDDGVGGSRIISAYAPPPMSSGQWVTIKVSGKSTVTTPPGVATGKHFLRISLQSANVLTYYLSNARFFVGTVEPAGLKRQHDECFFEGTIVHTEDFKPFEPISNGALIGPPKVRASSGSMRFNGGSPAFSLGGSKFRKSQGDSSDNDGEAKTTHGMLKPASETSFGCLFTVGTAPRLEPASSGASLELAVPALDRPEQGEVQTLMQLVSPNREGKTSTAWVDPTTYGQDTLGYEEGVDEGFDHPDVAWDGSLPVGGVGQGYLQHAPGRKDLELARIDLVAHRVSSVGGGTPTEDQLVRRYFVRSDFGRGATFDDYNLDPTSDADAGAAEQQHGTDKMFRASGSTVPGLITQNAPYDEDDNYWYLDSDAADDDLYCYVALCDKSGTPYANPSDIEGRTFAIMSGFELNNNALGNATEVGKQTLHVWDVTDPSDIFECVPVGSNLERRAAQCGLPWAASTLFGNSKYIIAIGGKIQPQGGEWWLGTSIYPSPIDADAYPYGCFPMGTNGDMRVDPRAMSMATGSVFQGAKGSFDGVFAFRHAVAFDTAESFFTELVRENAVWEAQLPQAAREIVESGLIAAWLCDVDGGPVIADAIGNMTIGLDESIPLALTTGKTQQAFAGNQFYALPTTIVTHKNLPYTYNQTVNASMFPDRLLPVRIVATGRLDGIFGPDDFSTALLANLGAHLEQNNVDPSKETLLGVLGHTLQAGKTDILVVSKTAIFRWDAAAEGTLKRIGSLPQHFSSKHIVSRDSYSGKTVLTNGAASPMIIGENGKPRPSEFIAAPDYGVPEIWARAWQSSEASQDPSAVINNVQLWPYVYKIAQETTFPKSRSVLGIERVSATDGIIWNGEMPSIGSVPLPPSSDPFKGLVKTSPLEFIRWSFFITYWSESLQSESQPGRAFTWANALPLRAPTFGSGGLPASGPNPDNQYTGEPNAAGLVLVMRGANPADYNLDGAAGTAQHYNLRIMNVPLSPNPNVTHIRIYRTIGNGSVFFLDKEVPIASGEDASDDTITILCAESPDTALSQPHVGGIASFVPAGARFTAAYAGRMYYAGFSWAPTRVYYSYLARPTSVPFFYFEDLVGAGPGPITGIYADADRCYVYKEDAVYMVMARDFDVFQLDQAATGGLPVEFNVTQLSNGAVGDRAITTVPEKGVVIAGDSSVLLQSGLQTVRISSPIDGEKEGDHDTSPSQDPVDESRIVYPYSLTNTKRDRWRAVFYPPLRAVLILGAPGVEDEPCLVMFHDLMEWVFWTGYNFDDVSVVSRFNNEIQEMWGIRDSRLWLLDRSEADGIDYASDDLKDLGLTYGSTNVATGTLTSVSGDDYVLSGLATSLPQAYQDILSTSATEVRSNDLLRDVYMTVRTGASGAVRFRSKIKYAYRLGAALHVVLHDTPANPGVAGDAYYVGSIDTHWTSGLTKPTRGREIMEALQLHAQVASPGVTVNGNTFRGDIEVYFGYDTKWPTGLFKTFVGNGLLDRRVSGFRGRGRGYSLMFVKRGAYAPIDMVGATLDANLLSGKGAMG